MRQLPALVFVVLSASCSGKKDAPPGPSYADRASFCHEWGVQSCNDRVISGCLATSADTCIAAAASDCESKIPSGKYSSSTAQACLDAVKAAYSDGTISASDRDLLIDLGGDCGKIVSGSGGTDDSCSEDSDCNRDQDFACVKKAGATTGKCEVPNPVDNGADCSAADAVCNEGFYCDDRGHCVQGGKQGDSCGTDQPCTTDFLCVEANVPATRDGGVADGGAPPSASATCQALKARGEVCTTDAECSSRICVVVDATKNLSKCADQIELVPGSKICASIQ